MTALAVPYRRAAADVLLALEHGGRGLYVAIGTSDAVQAAIEAKIEERFPVARLTYTGEELRPVGRIEEAGQTARCVSVRLRAPAEHVWRNLDVGREYLRAVKAAIVLWVDLAELQRFSDHAPNLWAVHASTLWCLSREDWPVANGQPEAGVGQTASWSALHTTILEARELMRAGDPERALAALPTPEEAQHVFPENHDWLWLRIELLGQLGRFVEAADLIAETPFDPLFPARRWLWAAELARSAHRWNDAVGSIRTALAIPRPAVWKETSIGTHFDLGMLAPTCVNVAMSLMTWVGRFDDARSLDARVLVLTKTWADRGNGEPSVAAFALRNEAQMAFEQLDLDEAIRLQSRVADEFSHDGGTSRGHVGALLADVYADLGLDEDAAHFRALAEAAPRPPAPSPVVTERIRQARLAVSPYARLEDAVERLEKAVEGDDRAAAHRELEAAERHWADEDPAYRSLRLRDRWQRAAAQLAEREGRPEDAIAILRALSNELAALPRTQCHARLALSRLLARAGHTAEAHDIAEEVRLKARSALSVGLERLAVDALLDVDRGDPVALARAERLTEELAP